MKKLFAAFLSLLCCLAMAAPAFADVIIPPELQQTATSSITESTETVSKAVTAGPDRTILFLVIGGAVAAAGLILYFLLRKRAK